MIATRWAMRIAATAGAVAFASVAYGADCKQRIDEAAAKVPDLSQVSTAEAKTRTGLTEEQIEAVLATLDAARLSRAAGEEGGCMTMVEAANEIIARSDKQK